MVNLTKLNNLSEFNFNNSLINDSTQITENIISTANTQSDGYFGLIVLTIIFLYLLYELMREDGFFRQDFVSSGIFASGIVIIIGIIMIVSTLITSYQHLIWYVIIFTLFLISSYFVKNR
jgi:uncharacterized membrane protein